jgi:uncharacterized protein (DUF58 family)
MQVTAPQHGSVMLSIQPRGAVLGGVGVAMGIAGLWRVDGVLASLGLAVACLLVISRILAKINSSRIEATLDCPEKVQAGVMFPLTLTLTNQRRWLDAFGLRTDLHLAGHTRLSGRAGWVAAGSAADFELRTSVPSRCRPEIHRLRMISDFPFGLFEAVTVLEVRHRLWVLPRPIVPRGLWFRGAVLDASDSLGSAIGESPGEPRGLRPWRHGDSPRRLIWSATLRSLARGGSLVVRESDPPGFRPLRCAVVFHSFGTDGGLIRPDCFERAISLTAGTLCHLQAQGISARLIADFDDWKSHLCQSRSQLDACLELLTRARRVAGTEAHDLQNALAGIDPDDGLIVISDMPPAAWRHVLLPGNQNAFIPEQPAARRGREVAR